MSEITSITHAPRCPSCGELLGGEPASDYFVWNNGKIVVDVCEDEWATNQHQVIVSKYEGQ